VCPKNFLDFQKMPEHLHDVNQVLKFKLANHVEGQEPGSWWNERPAKNFSLE
jgi:hypothetical protein